MTRPWLTWRRHARPLVLVSLLAIPGPAPQSARAAESRRDDLVEQGNQAFRKGDRTSAVALFTQAIAANPTNFVAYYNRGRLQQTEGHYPEAMADFNKLLELDPNHSGVRQLRGALHLRLGHLDEAIADFDRYLQRVPKAEPHHWQRGIAYYLAGRYDDACRQFTLNHSTDTNDVEIAVWHFLSLTRRDSLEKARAALLPVGRDPRVPMMTVYRLFAGQAKPEDVFKDAESGQAQEAERTHQLFFAHYYVGFHYEALGDNTRAIEHISKAASLLPAYDFMADIARVHAQILRQRKPSAKP